ncbi:branched-chain amino acid aminotransferase [Cohnella laeviribosi]|uniref:branched-chain amino acid aminotransferase n=1 Tax=Cohnella laeviribosi TaxID=380174 RepID=UPI003D1E0CEA
MNVKISVFPSAAKKPKIPASRLGFGRVFTDHMFIMNYSADHGWHEPRIIPYQPIALDPSAKVFHYGQTVFEGLKAHSTADGRAVLFRPDRHIERLNRSNYRLSIPPIDGELALAAIKRLVAVDRDWIPKEPGTALYIRPFIIATEPALGVAPSAEYRFIIIMSAVGPYYEAGINPVKIYVESNYVRAVAGGVGAAKAAGNYAAGLLAQREAAKEGYAQVLWLDGIHRRYIEEVGSMNVFFKIGDTVLTPALNGSILDGVTRDSVIRLLASWGVRIEERQISIDELERASLDGTLAEAFGTGTAAAVSPIGELCWQGNVWSIGNGRTGTLTARLYETLTGIQTGKAPDPFGWTVEV